MKNYLVVTPEESSYHNTATLAAQSFMPLWDWLNASAPISKLEVGDEYRLGEIIVVRLSGVVVR